MNKCSNNRCIDIINILLNNIKKLCSDIKIEKIFFK